MRIRDKYNELRFTNLNGRAEPQRELSSWNSQSFAAIKFLNKVIQQPKFLPANWPNSEESR